MKTAIDILKTCSDVYTAGGYYTITDEDSEILAQDGYEIAPETEVEDSVFDEMFNYFRDLYPDDPYFLQVGAPERGGKVPLEFKMGSMTELKLGDFSKWVKQDFEYIITEKLDGCSLGLTFENGKLKCAQSRGNGIEGADVTRHYVKFKEIGLMKSGKVRGEVIIKKEDIVSFLRELKEETGKSYKNARNAVAGQLNSKFGSKAFYKYAHFVAYRLIDYPEMPEEFIKQFDILKNNSFETVKCLGQWYAKDLNDDVLTELVKSVKDTSEYECDGIILTINTPTQNYTGFETGTLNPKDSRKFKIGSTDNQTETVVTDIIWQVSRDLLMKPVVIVNPVQLVGVTVTRASAHNYKWLSNKKLGVGSKIIIKRSGDVIPYVEEVLTESEDKNIPSSVEKNSQIVGVELVLNKNCPELNDYYDEANLKRLEHFCNTIKVDQAKYGNLKRLAQYSCGNIRDFTIENLILEPEESFTETIGVVGSNIYKSLHERLKDVEEPVFFDAVGAFGRLFGTLKLSKVCQKYGTLDVTKEQLEKVEGFAEKSINQYLEGLNEYHLWMKMINSDTLEGLVKFKKIEKIEPVSNSLKDLVVVFTGIRDKTMENFISVNGGRVASGVSSKVNLLIAKDPNSTSDKTQKARNLGIEIISYEEAKKRFG